MNSELPVDSTCINGVVETRRPQCNSCYHMPVCRLLPTSSIEDSYKCHYYVKTPKKLRGGSYLYSLRPGTIFKYNGAEMRWDGDNIESPDGKQGYALSRCRFITEEDCEILWEPSE